MAGEETTNQSNIKLEYNQGNTGINMDNTVNQVAKGTLTYALNASVENFDANSVNYQNEPGNELCVDFPTNYQLVGTHFIAEKNKHVFFLANPQEGKSEIGCMNNNDCKYITIVNADCLNFNTRYPILKIVHKITNCTTEIYWTDGFNPRRYLDLENIPYKLASGSQLCDPVYSNELDCNQLKMQPNFNIPDISVTTVTGGGALISGTYQFAVQYSDAAGNPYTSYYSVTNPTPIANTQITTPNFNYEVNKAIEVTISNLDVTGQFQYFNLAVIKTVNAITSVELAGIYFIDRSSRVITYTGQNQEQIKLTVNDVFEKYPYYDIAQDLTTVQDILVWDNLSSIDRINYQSIASQIPLQWQTYRIPADENYADELNATNLRGYLRDEVYAFEIVFLLKNGKQTDGFHIPGRAKGLNEIGVPDVPTTNPDFVGTADYYIGTTGYSPYWKIYNTGSVIGDAIGDKIGNATPHEYGEFAYWESTEKYPCNIDLWGDLADQPIRHHKFPDVLVSPIFETPQIVYNGFNAVPVMTRDAVFPIGVKVDVYDVISAIQSSNLTREQKADIVGFKIVRGDRGTNKSIVAKGILRNVGSYDREGTTYYFPNYPYNDLNEDPFLLSANNAYISGCQTYRVDTIDGCTIGYTDCITTNAATIVVDPNSSAEICSLSFPTLDSGTKTFLGLATYNVWRLTCNSATRGLHYNYVDPQSPNVNSIIWVPAPFFSSSVYSITRPTRADGARSHSESIVAIVTPTQDCGGTIPSELQGFNDDSKYRHVFNSPETSFGQPFLGNILKLENVLFGAGRGHFVEVNKNANYKLLTAEAQMDALNSSFDIANGDIIAAFTAYQAYLTIYINGITRRNYANSYNTIASYDYGFPINNGLGIKQREVDIAQYLIPGVQSVGDEHVVNNFNRESSVYIKTSEKSDPVQVTYTTYRICYNTNDSMFPFGIFQYTIPETNISTSIAIIQGTCQEVNSLTLPVRTVGGTNYTITAIATGQTSSTNPVIPLPFPKDTQSLIGGAGTPIITDESRYTISSAGICNNSTARIDLKVVSYYASLKNEIVNQWGQIYSYNTIDTGFQKAIDITNKSLQIYTVFGGDTFISRFAFKTKLPFFIDNRVGAPDDSDIFYDELSNVAYTRYWHSARSVLSNYTPAPPLAASVLTNIISYKAHNFDCPNNQELNSPGRTFYDGKMYLFAYGIPNFYCESSVNTDLRQAFNNKEGDFWPHVSTDIPDEWLQESFVTIAQDNTYYYNVTFSKQNKENFFSHLPPDWKNQLCYTYYPFRAIYSDSQEQNADNRVNNWLSYGAASLFDFPQNFGKLVSLDGIQNKAILARFENKSLLYNTLLTVDTSNPKAAYLGNDTLFKSSPPIDFAETDLGYVGSQNKFLLKIPQGQITIDAKRGQVFLISGNQAVDLSAFGSGLNRFFTDHLAFEILRYFPNADTDNHYNGIGLHGVYDSKYDRVIISKLDYIPATNNIKYDAVAKDFYIIEEIGGVELKTIIDVTDPEYFCNKSWTLSFNMNTKSWISFHSYIPNFYIAENNFFYSGLNGGCDLEAIAVEEIPIGSCFSVYNSGEGVAEINYVDVYGQDVPFAIDPKDTAYVCGISVMSAPGIVTTNLGSCINGCSAPTTTTTSTSTTTTTTTTLNPNCKCITFENLCPIPSSYEYYTCIDELVTGTLAPDEVLTVCGHDGSAGCEGVVITEGPDCTDVLTCVS